MQYATPRERLLKAAWTAERSTTDSTRHKCFLAYHTEDADEVADFVERFATVFVPRVIGISDADDFVDSADADYVMDCVREKYLADSTVTIVMVGNCTWARRYVDWEIYSTLRKDKENRLSGLVGVTLTHVRRGQSTHSPGTSQGQPQGDQQRGWLCALVAIPDLRRAAPRLHRGRIQGADRPSTTHRQRTSPQDPQLAL